MSRLLKFTLPLFVALVLCAPAISRAATNTEIQTQIQSLVAQIAALQAQLVNEGGGSSGGTSPTVVTSPNMTCVYILQTLSLGSTDTATGGEVSKLQQFLKYSTTYYPDGQVSGYYGPATQQAVRQWQAEQGIATPGTAGYGLVGPRTRAVITTSCHPTEPGVVPGPKPTFLAVTSFSASPSSIAIQGATKLTWTSTGADNCQLRDDTDHNGQLVADNIGSNGTRTMYPTRTTNYEIYCTKTSFSPLSVAFDMKFALVTVGGLTGTPSVTVVSPNGGETYVAGSNSPLAITWNASNVGPNNSVVTTLVNQATGKNYTFPGDASCTYVTNGYNSCTGRLIQNSGYDLGPGTYKAVVRVLGQSTVYGKDRPEVAVDTSNSAFTLTSATTGGDTSCAYSSHVGTVPRTATPSQSNTPESCKLACTTIRNEVFGLSDYGTCTFRSGASVQTFTIPVGTLTPPTPSVSSCTITASKTAVAIGEQYTLTWTTSNVTNPVMYQEQRAGGTVTVASSGSMTMVTPYVGTDIFRIGGGGLSGSYRPLCSVSVTASSSVSPTSASEVQAVGVYEGTYTSGTYGSHPTGAVSVRVTGTPAKPATLVLTSYEPVQWYVSVDSPASLARIVTVGYYDQKVTQVSTSVPVESHSYTSDGVNYHAYSNTSSDFYALDAWLRSKGLGITTFAGAYSGSNFTVYLGAKGEADKTTQLASAIAALQSLIAAPQSFGK